ncbi:MAG TPA: 2Fe-2S iron-sulfur cluster-binding protein [Terriglobia bacterium]|nr:2Fe-2S iron-sulfur cluster-binding protein [Terriglobia bacterium]
MGGTNPYIEQQAPEPATQKFKITFLPMNVTVEVDPEKIPYGVTGLPGSILDIGLAHGIDIDHSCGGVCACSTCHCIVREGGQTLSEMSDAEEDELQYAPGLTPSSRLSCQSVPDGTRDLVVEIPAWNRNLVREGH